MLHISKLIVNMTFLKSIPLLENLCILTIILIFNELLTNKKITIPTLAEVGCYNMKKVFDFHSENVCPLSYIAFF